MLRISLALSVCLVAWTWSCSRAADPLVADVSGLPVKDAMEKDEADWLKKLNERDFSTLEKIADELRSTNAKYHDGHSRYLNFYSSLGDIDDSNATEQLHLDRIALIDEWLVKNPKTVLGRMVLARAWFSYGYFARGTGWAKDVSEENMKKLRVRSERAFKLLDEIEKISPKPDLSYCHARVKYSKGLGEKPDRKWVYSALEIDPLNREVVTEMAQNLCPRWFGEQGDVEDFVDEVSKRATKSGAGDFQYASVSLFIFRHEGTGSLRSRRLDWSRIKKGLRDIEKRFPQPTGYFDMFARLAIHANDPKTAQELIEQIGETEHPEFWSPVSFPEWKKHVSRELLDGDQKQLIVGHTGPVTMLELRSGGKTIISCDAKLSLRTFDVATGKDFCATIEGGNPQSMSASGAANLIGLGYAEKPDVDVIQLKDNEFKEISKAKPAKLTQFTPEGGRLAVADETGSITIFDLKTQKELRTVAANPPMPVHEMQFSNSGQLLAAVSDAGLIRFIGPKADKDIRDWKIGDSNLSSVAWSLKGDRLAVGDREGHVKVFTWPARKPLRTLDLEPVIVASLDFSPDGRQLAIGLCGENADVEVTDPLRLVAVVGDDPPTALNGHKFGVRKVRFQSDGKLLVSGSDDWTIRTWELKPPKK